MQCFESRLQPRHIAIAKNIVVSFANAKLSEGENLQPENAAVAEASCASSCIFNVFRKLKYPNHIVFIFLKTLYIWFYSLPIYRLNILNEGKEMAKRKRHSSKYAQHVFWL